MEPHHLLTDFFDSTSCLGLAFFHADKVVATREGAELVFCSDGAMNQGVVVNQEDSTVFSSSSISNQSLEFGLG